MPGDSDIARPSFHVLRFMVALRAARDFGLDPIVANRIALRFDPRRRDVDHLIDALAAALIEQGALELPHTV